MEGCVQSDRTKMLFPVLHSQNWRPCSKTERMWRMHLEFSDTGGTTHIAPNVLVYNRHWGLYHYSLQCVHWLSLYMVACKFTESGVCRGETSLSLALPISLLSLRSATISFWYPLPCCSIVVEYRPAIWRLSLYFSVILKPLVDISLKNRRASKIPPLNLRRNCFRYEIADTKSR